MNLNFIERLYLRSQLKAKLQEFKAAGYDHVQLADLGNYLKNYLWPRKKATTFKAKRELLKAVTPYDYFDYQQLQIQTHQQAIGEMDDFSDLF